MYNDELTKEEATKILDSLVTSPKAKLHEWDDYYRYEKGEINKKDVHTWSANAEKKGNIYYVDGCAYDTEDENFTGSVFELMEFSFSSWE